MKDYSTYFNKHTESNLAKNKIIYNRNLIPEQLKTLARNKNYYVKTFGCQSNVRDSEQISGILELIGYIKTENIQEADLIIVNTCAIRANAENKVLGELGYIYNLKKRNPNLIYGFCGCLAQNELIVNKLLHSNPEIDLVFGTHNIHRLPDLLLDAYYSNQPVIEIWSQSNQIVESIPSHRTDSAKAFVNIMYGCNHFCTYCIVPYTRGPQKSRQLKDILNEINDLIDMGYQEITLLGQNVNSYGLDINYSFDKLLKEVSNTGIPRIRFMTSNPWDFNDKIINAIRDYNNIMPFIHLPLQSGSDLILKKMGRKNTVDEYLSIVNKLKSIDSKKISLSSDFIVGFPGETDNDFLATLNVIDKCQYDTAYTFIYSQRPNTPAVKFISQIPLEVKKTRLSILKEKIDNYALINNNLWVGKTVPVLIDYFDKKLKKCYGYSPQNKIVCLESVSDNYLHKIINVKITAAKMYSLVGEIL